jgi:putative transposase
MNEFPNRKKIRLQEKAYEQGHVFSIVISTAQRYPWFEVHPELAEKISNLIVEIASQREAEIYAWCVMPDHVHFLLSDKNIIDFVRLIKGRLTPIARNLESGRVLWQRSFYDHALRKEDSLSEVATYIWENPVRAGIVDRFSDYPWSGSMIWPDWRRFGRG